MLGFSLLDTNLIKAKFNNLSNLNNRNHLKLVLTPVFLPVIIFL